MLLAALGARRPTRDIDFSTRALSNDSAEVLRVAQEIAGVTLDDGLVFDSKAATAETIRENDDYSGVRITLGGTLSRALIQVRHGIPALFSPRSQPGARRPCLAFISSWNTLRYRAAVSCLNRSSRKSSACKPCRHAL